MTQRKLIRTMIRDDQRIDLDLLEVPAKDIISMVKMGWRFERNPDEADDGRTVIIDDYNVQS